MKSLIENCMKLGFGMMRLPRISVNGEEVIDVEQTKDMVDAFLAAGGRYIDTAFVYTGSEEATRKALVERYPRDAYYLATKLNAGSWAAKNEQEAKDQFRISLERTGAGYFDFYLLHALGRGNVEFYDRYGIWDYVKGLKKEGLIRHNASLIPPQTSTRGHNYLRTLPHHTHHIVSLLPPGAEVTPHDLPAGLAANG
jgi:predicted aldo/keto reductase-like oxidoreductase